MGTFLFVVEHKVELKFMELSIMNMLLILLVTILGVNAEPTLDRPCTGDEDCRNGEICKNPQWKTCRGICVPQPQDCRYQKDMCKSDEECVISSPHDCYHFPPCKYVCRPYPFPEGQCRTSSDCKPPYIQGVCIQGKNHSSGKNTCVALIFRRK